MWELLLLENQISTIFYPLGVSFLLAPKVDVYAAFSGVENANLSCSPGISWLSYLKTNKKEI